MAPLAIPALVALLFKVVLLAYALRAPRRHLTTRLFVLLLALFTLHNLVEVYGFNHFATAGLDRQIEICGYLYFSIGIVFFAVLLHLSLCLSTDNWERWRQAVPLLYLPVPILEYLLLGTDQLVAGFRVFENYTILRVPGPLYFLFETYAPLYLLAALAYLVYGARGARRPAISRLRNRFWLAGLLPFVLLNGYLIVANHFGQAKLSASVFIPIAVTLFLIVTTYATHQHRLFDIEFYIPGSAVRKRKTAFYGRIQAVIAEIADLRSVGEVLQRLADALRCSVALVGGPRPTVAPADGSSPTPEGLREALSLAQFPQAELEKIDHIVIAQEIAETRPQTYALMQRYKVAAIVPFHPHSDVAANWMLLGERFSEEVYSPLDFRAVETLFDRLGERFLDQLQLLRAQITEANEHLQRYQQRLALAWDTQQKLEKALTATEAENRDLRARNATLWRKRMALAGSVPAEVAASERALDDYLAECEAAMIKQTLADCEGNRFEAARRLRLRPDALFDKMKRFGLAGGEDA